MGISSLASFFELSVLLKDVHVRGASVRYVGVVVSAQDVRSAIERVMANSPTPLGVAIDLANARVHPDANRTYECRLTEVGTKTRPEVVIEIWPSMEGTGVKRYPMSYCTEERDEEGKSDDDKYEE